MVIDPASWAQQDLSARVLRYASENAEACLLADQSTLNAVMRGEFVKLSPVWNMMSVLWFRSRLADFVSPAVFHYSGSSKPWRPLTWPYDSAVCDLYRDFFRRTPWPDAVSWSGSPAEWRNFLKSRYRAMLRRLRGKTPSMLVSAQTMQALQDFLHSTPFADIQQGLAVWRPDGSLHAA